MSFSHRRENDEKSRRDSRLGLSIFCREVHIHGSKVLQCSRARTGHHSPCRNSVRLGSSRPQAQGARRVSAFRYDINKNGGG